MRVRVSASVVVRVRVLFGAVRVRMHVFAVFVPVLVRLVLVLLGDLFALLFLLRRLRGGLLVPLVLHAALGHLRARKIAALLGELGRGRRTLGVVLRHRVVGDEDTV